MTQDELMNNVKAKLPGRIAISANYVQSRYHVLQASARKVIADLQVEGLISKEWDTQLGGYAVLVKEGEPNG